MTKKLKLDKNSYEIVIDTREKNIDHIVKKFNKEGINHVRLPLKIGDYTIKGEAFHNPKVVVERKASIDELLQNLIDRDSMIDGKNRFQRELDRATDAGLKLYILIENANWYADILNQNYCSKMATSSASGLIVSLLAKYPNISIIGIDKPYVASFIHKLLHHSIKQNMLKMAPITN